ncbi:MAG: hypothetical protein EPN47_20020 [Acidobacteria bacterium]|nr:MAG: hypothetical protein EPN47_20020 [Acidobacteriota bacterium]
MNRDDPCDSGSAYLRILTILLTLFFAACSSSVSPPRGSGVDYQQAKVMFKQGNLDRALSLTDAIAEANSNSPDALNARVLRAVIYSGRIDAYRELADTYKKGSDIATKSQAVASYNRRRSNALQYGGGAALDLGEVVMQMTSKPDFPKELTLDAPWPDVEGPQVIDALTRIRRGAWVPEEAQDSAGLDAQHKGIDDVLAELVGGNRSKVRTAMQAGPVKLNGLDFALFLEKQMVEGLELFGPKYLANPGQVKTLCDVANRLASPIETTLKENPDKAREAAFKKFQKQIKDAEKFT